MFARLEKRLWSPVDGASLAVFRVFFGLLGFIASARFLWNDWVTQFFGKPRFFFSYWGTGNSVPSVATLEWLFVALAVLSLMIAAGLFYRFACVAFFLIFTWIELLDVTYYLNHYYLVSLLALLFCFLPLNRVYSLDALRKPHIKTTVLPAWALYLLRFQVAMVYLFAAVAKMTSDWLFHAQPLNIWLSSRVDTPILGPLFEDWWFALALSWAGFLNDLLVVPLLLWARTRIPAYIMLVIFHGMTGYLFNIGMFPIIMLAAATIFFAPEWPRRFFPTPTESATPKATRPSAARRKFIVAALGIYAFIQIALPLRSHVLYSGDVNWHEQGMRWSWKVMVREKAGSITYRVRLDGVERERYVYPHRYLTPYQEREMSGQPDLILQLGHHIGQTYQAQGFAGVEVRVDALVSLNGRPLAPLIDPNVDLMTLDDSIMPASWILDAPQTPPIRLERRPLTAQK